MPAGTNEPVVEIINGKIRGGIHNNVFYFKGIPYGADTCGANRFLPPQPVADWTGVRDALDYGHRAPQRKSIIKPQNEWIRGTQPTGEDCLVLNVFTPGIGDGAKRPVMVWLHGGGYVTGSGGAPGVDGTNLAKRGDVVVVTLNHRLNTFGYTHLAGVKGADERFVDAGNAGMLDLVAALKWVQQNIEAFGGDAGNVTIFGQSGGGSKVAVMMTTPAAKGLFHKAIIQSSSSHLRLATEESAARAAHQLLKELDISDVSSLRTVPVGDLHAAYTKAVTALNGNDSFRPVVDGRTIMNHPFDRNAPDLASDIPLMIGSCETEKSFYDITADPATLPMNADQLQSAVENFVHLDSGRAAGLIADYREARPDATGRDLYNVIASDHMYRRNEIEAAEIKSQQGGAPAYLYEFTWKTPVMGGMLKTPHTLCIPFVFGNTAIAEPFTGTGPEQDALTDKVMGAWIAFAKTGCPDHPGLPAWTPYNMSERPTMIFDNDCRVENDPKSEDRERMAACPPFISDEQFPVAAKAA